MTAAERLHDAAITAIQDAFKRRYGTGSYGGSASIPFASGRLVLSSSSFGDFSISYRAATWMVRMEPYYGAAAEGAPMRWGYNMHTKSGVHWAEVEAGDLTDDAMTAWAQTIEAGTFEVKP